MMFGTKDEFAYFKCSNCGCIQIKEIPKNLSRYYPSNYYSLKSKGKKDYLKSVIRIIARLIISGIWPQFLSQKEVSLWIKKAKINSNSKILDVGSGSGELLKKFAARGFKHLIGVDPYLKKDILYRSGIKIFKKDLSLLKGRYDFIMLHHSLEHMDDPGQVLADIHRLLKPGGRALIRIPVASSLAWEKYQSNQERNKFINTLISRNSEELKNIEIVEKSKPVKEQTKSDLIAEEDLPDEDFMKLINKNGRQT